MVLSLRLAFGTPVVLRAGWPFFDGCVHSIRNRTPNMWTLIVGETGTLTEGRPAFREVEATDGFDADEVLRTAASLDQEANIRSPPRSWRKRTGARSHREPPTTSNR